MGELKDWMCSYLPIGCNREPTIDEVEALTTQFHITLRAYITKVEESAQEPVPKALERIREITRQGDENLCWKDAYDIEQQLVQLYDASTLRIELYRRLLDADQSLHPAVAGWYRERAKELDAPEDQAALLSRLINDLQWRYTRNEARRGYTKDVTARTEKIYALAFVLFLGILLQLAWSLAGQNGISTDNPWLFPFVGFAGAFGAAFSMMTSLKTRLADSSLDDLKLNRSWGLIFARVLVGIGAGFILFFFVRSGLLGGQAFPELAELRDMEGSGKLIARTDFAKLFIWCFLAGFSEKLVPNLLSKTEEAGGGQGTEPAHTLDRPPARPVPPMRERGHRPESAPDAETASTVAPEKQ